MKQNVLVYISGPMTAKHGYTIEENTAAGLRVYLDLMRRGIPSFCPHLSAAFPSALELPFDMWIEYDCRIIDRCSHLLMMPRWKESVGAVKEHEYASSIDKPTAYNMVQLEALLQ